MITIREARYVSDTDLATAAKNPMTEVRCLSTDTKPTNIPNGSTLVEIDTGKKFLYDATNSQWNEVSSGGGGGGGGESVPENDVMFIDYDGTILHSYTKQEFLALDSLPDNPTHDGLTAQGWNWTLADAKAHVTALDELIIGQSYITDDGATRLYVTIDENTLEPAVNINMIGKVTVDWGDNTTPDSQTKTTSTVTTFKHTYSESGDYVISIMPDEGASFYLVGSNTTQTSLFNCGITNYQNNTAYPACVNKVEVGANCRIGYNSFNLCNFMETVTLPLTSMPTGGNNMQSAFNKCRSLRAIVFPPGMDFTTNSGSVCAECFSLIYVSLPKSVNNTQSSIFNQCNSLRKIIFPSTASFTSLPESIFNKCETIKKIVLKMQNINSIASNAFYQTGIKSIDLGASTITTINAYTFYNCRALQYIEIPDTVTSLANYVFGNCAGMLYIKFKSATPPTVTSSSAFQSVFPKCKIYVPAGSLSAYTSATNYPSSANYTYEEY